MAKTIKEERVKTLVICGDLTDKKDYHPSELVNQVVRVIMDLLRDCPGTRIIILVGNHDWLKDGQEYFRFLNHLPDVTFVTEPWEDSDPKGALAMFLPYSKNPVADWRGLDFSHYEYLFLHQTVKGAISSNGMAMEGEELPRLSDAGKVYSGDIHVPQIVKTPMGTVEYIGSPYHVHFGDDFKPRAVLLEKGGRAIDLHFETIKRVAIKATSLDDLLTSLCFTRKGDQVKVVMKLSEADKHDWRRIRRTASEYLANAKVEVHGLEMEVERSERRITKESAPASRRPAHALLHFVEAEDLPAVAYDVASEVVDE